MPDFLKKFTIPGFPAFPPLPPVPPLNPVFPLTWPGQLYFGYREQVERLDRSGLLSNRTFKSTKSVSLRLNKVEDTEYSRPQGGLLQFFWDTIARAKKFSLAPFFLTHAVLWRQHRSRSVIIPYHEWVKSWSVSNRYQCKISAKPLQKPREVVIKILMFITRAILRHFSSRLIYTHAQFCSRGSL